MIGVINLGNSNLTSLTNSLNYLKIEYIIIDEASSLKLVDKIIFPGVGTFGNGVKRLKELSLFDEIIKEVTEFKKPILGICLGMQLLFEYSNETKDVKGLSLLNGNVVNLPKSTNYSIPRIGWADSNTIFDFLGLKKNDKFDFYYIHSFYVEAENKNIISIESDDCITAAVKDGNIYGCQFHPEKSHLKGLNILKSFSEIKKGKEQ